MQTTKKSEKPGVAINPPVFFTAGGLLIAFVIFGVVYTETASRVLPAVLDAVSTNFGWLYVAAVAFFLVFAVWLMFSRYSHIRLGDDDERPEFSRFTWFSMLFSAGMGIGIVFYGVAEPMLHYTTPPAGEGQTMAAAKLALPTTFFHWGIHAWAIYVLMALSIAYFSYRKKLPLAIRSCFYPLLGERIHGWAGHLIDITAVFGTLFGLATSLGLGAMQVSAGVNYLFDTPHTTQTQLIIIGTVTLAATVSLVTGVKKGIRRLSELNLVLAGLLMLVVFIVGPTLFIIESFIENIGRYGITVVTRTLRVVGLNETQDDWMKSWTLFYWGWWIAWAPFVGMFVARVSRGRTIGEFILGVLLVPTAVTLVWFSVFGGTALHLEMFGGGGIAAAVDADVSTAIFVLLDRLPLSAVLSFIAACVVVVFFVTSSDSASFVVDMLTSGGHPNPPIWQRVFWAVAEGTCAAVLLYAGGSQALTALQAAVICIGLPFCLVLLVMSYSLLKALREEASIAELDQQAELAMVGGGVVPMGIGWRAPAVHVHQEHSAHGVQPGGSDARAGGEQREPAERPEADSSRAPAGSEPKSREAGLPRYGFDRILVPTDYSPHSLRAVAYACELADRVGEGVVVDVLHVAPPPTDYLPIDEFIWGEAREPSEMHQRLEQAAKRALDSYVQSLPARLRERINVRLEIGLPYRVILNVAQDGHYDMLVIGSHGRTASQQVRLGSIAERLLRFAPCTVVTVR